MWRNDGIMRLLLMTNACRMASGRRFVFLPMCFRTPSREFGIRQGEHRDTQSFIVSRLKWSTQNLSRSFASGLEVTFANGVSGREASRKRCRAGCILGRQAFPPPRCGASGQTLCALKFIHARVKALCISVFPLPSYIELTFRHSHVMSNWSHAPVRWARCLVEGDMPKRGE